MAGSTQPNWGYTTFTFQYDIAKVAECQYGGNHLTQPLEDFESIKPALRINFTQI